MREGKVRLPEQDTAGNFDWRQALEKSRPAIILGIAGLVLVSAGILAFLIFRPQEPEIEILSAEADSLDSTILVDLGGAVLKPGVYELPGGSRVNDLLIRAGGLAEKADRGWVEKNLNLAQKLTDGIKLYIPRLDESTLESAGQVAGATVQTTGKININTASTSELDSLWGIGQARAAEIINNRPYSFPEELLERKIIPSNVYERIKDEIAVF